MLRLSNAWFFVSILTLILGSGCGDNQTTSSIPPGSPNNAGAETTDSPGQPAAEKNGPLSIPQLPQRPFVWLDDYQAPEPPSPQRQAARELLRYADIFKATEKFERAEELYLDVIEAQPTMAYAPYQLACNYELWGKHDQAVASFQQAIDAGFDDFPTALGDDELGKIRERDDFTEQLLKIRKRYIASAEDRVGQPIAVKPVGDEPSGGWPVLFLLHGRGDSPVNYLDNAQAWAKLGVLAIALPGTVPAQDGRFIWSDASAEPTHAAIQEVLDSPELGNVDRKRVYLLGFSQGALHAMVLAMDKPGEYAGVVSLSPGGPMSERISRPTLPKTISDRCLVFIHGDDEPHAPYVTIWEDACQRSGWRFLNKTHAGGHHFPEDWETTRPEIARFLLARTGD